MRMLTQGEQADYLFMRFLFYLTRKRHVEEVAIEIGIVLLFWPEYIDDGFCGGGGYEMSSGISGKRLDWQLNLV